MTVGMVLLSLLDVHTTKPTSLYMARARHGYGLPDADHDADRAEQRRAEGPRRGQQRGDVLPVDRWLVRRLAVRRDLQPPRCSATCGVGASAAEAVSRRGEQHFRLGGALPHPVVAGIATATSTVFFWSIFLAVLVPVLALFVKHSPCVAAPAAAPRAATPRPTGARSSTGTRADAGRDRCNFTALVPSPRALAPRAVKSRGAVGAAPWSTLWYFSGWCWYLCACLRCRG